MLAPHTAAAIAEIARDRTGGAEMVALAARERGVPAWVAWFKGMWS
jgi:hypothetical protein